MAGKLNRAGYEQLIAGDQAWLQRQPRTLERDHIMEIVKDSVRAYYDPPGDCPAAPMPGKAHEMRDGKCINCERAPA
jgi:hypothetical protein